MDSFCDVIVVGAGPAGTTAARLCAQAGLETVIIERATFPREKPCAGGLSPRAVADLARIFGLASEVDRAVLGVPHFSLRAHFYLDRSGGRGGGPGGRRAGGTRGPAWSGYRRIRLEKDRPLMYVTRRGLLDECLLARAAEAGARVMTGTEVVALGRDKSGVWVTVREAAARQSPPRPVLVRTVSGRFLIGADGAASFVAGATREWASLSGPAGSGTSWSGQAGGGTTWSGAAGSGPARERAGGDWGAGGRGDWGPVARCLSLYVPLDPAAALEVTGGSLDFHFGLIRGGYGWAFPGASGLAAGVGALITRRAARADTVREAGPAALSGEPGARPCPDLRAALTRLLALYGLDLGAAGGPPRGWFVPLGGFRRPWERERVLLVGDAAGVANPLTGEGIGPAVRSAALAAAAVISRATGEGQDRRGPVRPTELLAAAFGLGRRGGPGGDYSRSLWEGEVAGQRLGLRLVEAASRFSPERQVHLFRRAVFSRLATWMAGAGIGGSGSGETGTGGDGTGGDTLVG